MKDKIKLNFIISIVYCFVIFITALALKGKQIGFIITFSSLVMISISQIFTQLEYKDEIKENI